MIMTACIISYLFSFYIFNQKEQKNWFKIYMFYFSSSADLVPIYSFGENEVFDQVENPRGTWLRYIQERLQSIMGISLPLFHARGVFQYSFGLMPYRKPINTVGKRNQILIKYHHSGQGESKLKPYSESVQIPFCSLS